MLPLLASPVASFQISFNRTGRNFSAARFVRFFCSPLAALVPEWRVPILLYSALEKSFMVWLVLSNAQQSFVSGFWVPLHTSQVRPWAHRPEQKTIDISLNFRSKIMEGDWSKIATRTFGISRLLQKHFRNAESMVCLESRQARFRSRRLVLRTPTTDIVSCKSLQFS